jgi:hypothetical protein
MDIKETKKRSGLVRNNDSSESFDKEIMMIQPVSRVEETEEESEEEKLPNMAEFLEDDIADEAESLRKPLVIGSKKE